MARDEEIARRPFVPDGVQQASHARWRLEIVFAAPAMTPAAASVRFQQEARLCT